MEFCFMENQNAEVIRSETKFVYSRRRLQFRLCVFGLLLNFEYKSQLRDISR